MSAAFDEAVALPEAERAGFLAALAAAYPALAVEVRSLLAADRGTGDLVAVAQGAARDLAAAAPAAHGRRGAELDGRLAGSLIGSLVGEYRLLHCLGRGGMGEVWEGERADGRFEQRVAIKILRHGLDTDDLIARFVRERQILARLEHPGITRLFDGGVSGDGRPYLVMERVAGVPITDWAAEHRLSLVARLELFLAVTDAVEAAHRALVVHRDLKPSNILVDGGGRPRLLDFGIAKLLDADEVGQTALFQAPFTPAYAAPEQILGGQITTACDVYALGVVLFELLTGSRPFARRARLPAQLAAEIEREDAPRPSDRLRTTVTRGLATVVGHTTATVGSAVQPAARGGAVAAGDPRQVAAGSAAPRAPEPPHGLPTTNAGGRDGPPEGRSGQPAADDASEGTGPGASREVTASAPAAIEDHPVAAIDADLDAIVLRAIRREPNARYPTVDALASDVRRYLAGQPVEARGGAFAYRAGKFLRRHRLAVVAVAAVVVALVGGAAVALWQAARATREAARAQRVERFLVDIFAQADPSHTLGERLTARQVLDQGAARIARELDREPQARASLEEALAQSYRGLGLYGEARRHAESAVALRREVEGESAVPVAVARVTLAEVLSDAGELALARAAAESAVAVLRHRRSADEALARGLSVLAAITHQEGDFAGALAINQEAVERVRERFGEDAVETAVALDNLAITLASVGRYEEGIATLEDGLARIERAGEGKSPKAGTMHTNLADLLDVVGRFDEAEKHFRQGLELQIRAWGERHPEVGQTLLKYGFTLLQRRRLVEADAMLRRAVEVFASFDHYDVANAWRYLGYCALARERWQEAEEAFTAAELRLRRDLGEDHTNTWVAVVSLAQAKLRLGKLDEAEAMSRASLAAFIRQHGAESNEVRTPMKTLGEIHRLRGDLDEALAVHRRVLALERQLFSTDDHLGVVASKRHLALDLLARPTAANLAEARELLDGALTFLRASPAEAARLPEVLEVSGRVALAAGDRERARRDLAEALAGWAADAEPDPAVAVEVGQLLAGLSRSSG